MMHGPEKSDSAIVAREADEQSGVVRYGVGGAKGMDQGECGPIQHAPDSEPDKRDNGVGSHTAKFCRRYPRWEPHAGKPHVRIKPFDPALAMGC
jgi:hypothetical protein